MTVSRRPRSPHCQRLSEPGCCADIARPLPPSEQHSARAARIRLASRPGLGMVAVSQPPGAGESGFVPAAEGATGPRKRSGTRDRDGT
jgi:hypothetical protein